MKVSKNCFNTNLDIILETSEIQNTHKLHANATKPLLTISDMFKTISESVLNCSVTNHSYTYKLTLAYPRCGRILVGRCNIRSCIKLIVCVFTTDFSLETRGGS